MSPSSGRKARRSPTILVAEGKKQSAILEAEGEKQSAILHAEAEKEKMIREAEGEAEAILKVQQAAADGIRFIKEAGADDAVLKIKSLEAFEKAADGQGDQDHYPIRNPGTCRNAGLCQGSAQ